MERPFFGQTELIVREIQRLHRQRQPLNLFAAKRYHPELVVSVFRVRPFWGWIQALRDAGIDYDEINVELDEFTECRICGGRFHRLQHHLKVHGTNAEEYIKEFQTETTSEADRAAGQRKARECRRKPGQLPLWDAPWCEEILLDRIAEYQRHGISLNFNEIDHRERTLVNYAVAICGSWDAALKKVGIEPTEARLADPPGRIKYPTPASVLVAIRDRHRKGLPLNHAALAKTSRPSAVRDVTLVDQAVFFFGDWDSAISQAELPPQRLSQPSSYTTPEKVLEDIERRHREGLTLIPVNLSNAVAKRDKDLYRKGIRMFGSWKAALFRAGLVYFRGAEPQPVPCGVNALKSPQNTPVG